MIMQQTESVGVSLFHRFDPQPEVCELPQRFTFPFQYVPHPLVVRAASQLREMIRRHEEWLPELDQGKMLGVLVVRCDSGEIGFCAAFSGNLCGSNRLPGFVPPVFDFLDPQGFFKPEEARISALNERLRRMQSDPELLQLQHRCRMLQLQADEELAHVKRQVLEARQKRELRRQTATDEEKQEMNRESQFQKAELKRLEKRWRTLLAEEVSPLQDRLQEMEALKQERKRRSAALQQQIFDRFTFLNARGESLSLGEIFRQEGLTVPPAGAGECAAPKLLQYAFLHRLQPLAMGEFWWGTSPVGVLRRDGHFYPSCISKCKPILTHMLQGLSVDPDPVLSEASAVRDVTVVYEDDYLVVVNKPAGMYSVPGKDLSVPSVYDWARERYPEADGPLVVHRLDMATSGLLLLAKTKQVHETLQRLFLNKEIRKRYVACLDGQVVKDEGYIRLPLCADWDHRPRQMVDWQNGKPAVTWYQVVSRSPHQTRVWLYPLTGRTHQLRVHAAHPDGLNAPIHGDALYGCPDGRLLLHAAELSLLHPVTGQRFRLEAPEPF